MAPKKQPTPNSSTPKKPVGSSGSPGGSYRTSPQNTKANNAQTNRDLKKSFDKYGSVSDIKTDRNGRVISASTGWGEPVSKNKPNSSPVMPSMGPVGSMKTKTIIPAKNAAPKKKK